MYIKNQTNYANNYTIFICLYQIKIFTTIELQKNNNNIVKPSSPKEHLSKSNVNTKKMISKIQKEKIDKIFENLPTAKMARNMEEICSLFNANTFSD